MKGIGNIAWKSLGALVPTVAWLLLVTAMVDHLGPRIFGMSALVFGILSFSQLLTLGLVPTLSRESARLVAGGDMAELGRVAARCAAILTGLGLLAALAMLALVAWGQGVLQFTPDERIIFTRVGVLASAYLVLTFPLGTAQALMDGMQAFRADAAMRAGQAVLFTTLAWGSLVLGHGLLALVGLYFACSLATSGARIAFVRARLPNMPLRLEWSSDPHPRQFLASALVMSLWSVSGTLVHQTDRVLIAVFAPLEAVGAYDLGARMNDAGRLLLFGGLPALLPQAAAADSRGPLRDLHILLSKVLLGAVCAAIAWLAAFGQQLFTVWTGPSFGDAATVAILLLIATAYQAQHVAGHFVLAGLGITRPLRNASLIAPILNLGLCLVLGWRYGLFGIAWATLLTMLVSESILWNAVRGALAIPIAVYLRRVHAPVAVTLLLAALPWLAIAALGRLPHLSSWAEIVACAVAAAATFGLAVAFVLVTKAERHALRGLLPKVTSA